MKLGLDKYIQENRASDEIARRLTQGKSTLAFIGSANMAPNSPIGIKRRLRCPGTRKLVKSFKKLGNVTVRFVDEFKTSQTCGKCFRAFDPRTKRNRYKVCHACMPSCEWTWRWQLPTKIIAEKSNREIERDRKAVFENGGPEPGANRLVSKINVYFKNWQPNHETGNWQEEIALKLKTVWHRDVVAAKCILYKGMCCIALNIFLLNMKSD